MTALDNSFIDSALEMKYNTGTSHENPEGIIAN